MKGFTVFELILILAIIGILASLAVATYQTHTVRSQVSDGLELAESVKQSVIDAYVVGRIAPANRIASGLSPSASDTRSSSVSSIEIVDGRIDIRFGGPVAHQDIIGTNLSLSAYEIDDGGFVWRCGFAPPPGGVPLEGGARHIDPTLQQRYLPAECRS